MTSIGGIPLSIFILIGVFILIAVRQVGNVRLRIWQIMLVGAVLALISGEIGPVDAALSINLDVMFFLFGVFIIGEALHQSGYLSHISYKIFRRAKNVDMLVLLILFVIGGISALLMNDTLAIIGTPLVLTLAKKFDISPKLMLMALAIAVTTGSVMSPIGNPQNLLIALDGSFESPFVTFFSYLAIPTVINLFVAFLVLRLFFRDEFTADKLNHSDEPVTDPRLAVLCKISLALMLLLIAVKIALVFLGTGFEMRLTYIALIAAAPIVLLSRQRASVVRKIDWSTLVFFAAMFVLMQAVWNTGFFQNWLSGTDVTTVPMTLGVSVGVSQLISNVPFVALFMQMLGSADQIAMLALAAGSTIAGNLFILGAASNVIIIQNAEKRGETLKFIEFAKIGIPLTAMNILVYWVFLTLFQ
jgi:Na+/H+ antiporter NhaD/arsenite permease-like protein